LALGALRALALGDRAGADSVLRLARIETRVELLNSSWFYSQSAEQFERAALARWRGRTDLALATYAAAQHSRLQAAPAAFAIGEMYEERGNPQAAMREYRRVVHLFAAAEPAGQLLAEQAGRRLSALGAR
jgi:tetratricopeptide (TPR) repeat protein